MAAVDKIAEALRGRLFYGTHADRWNDQDWQTRFFDDGAEAVIAAIKEMSPSDLAELIGGEVEDEMRWLSDGLPPAPAARVVGPWIAEEE